MQKIEERLPALLSCAFISHKKGVMSMFEGIEGIIERNLGDGISSAIRAAIEEAKNESGEE